MTKKSGTNTNTNTNGNNCSSRPPLPPSSPARHQDSDGKKMNGGSHSYSYYYRNNGNNTPSPFNESIASSLSANSEQFTTMSASEASSILEQHIARHPIQSEADFHYIAELLKNFENEEDLKRIAELLRASDPKFQQQQQQQPQRTAPTVEDEQEFEKGKKKKKSKMAKKAKKAKKKKHRKKEPSIVSEDGNEDYESEDSSNSSDDDEDDDGSYSSSSSSSSSRSTGEDLFEDDYITSSSSSTITSDKRRKRKKEKQKEKQRKRKEKKRKRLEREREKEKQRKREKKERKRLKKEKKQLKKKGKKKMKLQQQLEGGIDNTPPAQIHVIGEEEERETWDDEDAIVSNEISHQRTIAKKDGDIERNQATGELLKSTVANKAGKQPSPSSGSSKDQEKIVASTPSKTDLEDLDKSKTLREIFEDNSQKAPAPDRKAKEEEKRHAIVPEEQAKPSPDESPTEIFQDEVHEDSSKRNENEIEDLMASFPYPGMIQNNKRPSARSSGQRQQMLDSDNSLVLEESFGNDHARQSSSKGMPSLPEDGVPEFTPMDSSKSLPSSKNPTKEKSEEISQDSWAQPEGSSWKGDPELGIQRTASSRHAPSLPTIFSSTRESLCSAQDEENDNRVGELADHPEKQQGGRESKSSGDDSTTSSRDLPEDELENLAMHFSASLNENIPKPAVGDANRGKGGYSTLPQNDSNNNDARKNTEYPPVITETSFARQESSTMARHVVPLPSSKLNASLVFGRQPSTSVLNKTLELSRKTSSETYKGLSSSVLRPPSTRRLDSGVVSTQDFDAMRDAMRASHQSAQVMESGEIFHAKVDIEPTIQSPLIVQADDSPAEGIPSREMIQAELTVKPRLLCLHGWRSNAEITRLQLENLGLLDFFDPIFIEGPHISDKPADDAVSLLSQGPYYSWLNQMSTFHSEDEDGNGQQSATFESSRQRKSNRSWKGAKTLRQSLYNFRQVMGDSGGRSSDEDPATEELLMSLKAVMMHLLTESRYLDAFSQENEEIANIPCYDAVYGFSQGATLVTLLSYEFVRNQILEEMNLPPMNRMPWKFVISACAANVSMKELLAYHFEMNFEVKLPLPSVHLIGLSDTRKGQSEAIMKEHYNQQQVFPIYLDSGHGIPAATRKLVSQLRLLHVFSLLACALTCQCCFFPSPSFHSHTFWMR